MIHTLKCPSCGAPLEYEDKDERASVRCPFCNNTVVVPDNLRGPRRVHISVGGARPILRAVALVVLAVVVITVGGVITAITGLLKPTPRPDTRPVVVVPPLPPHFFPTPPGSAKPPAEPPGFASLGQKFGGEGTGPGKFTDLRSIALDGDGRIYVGDYTGGRIQVFDASGKFLTQWMVDPQMPLRGLAVDRRGTAYVVQSGKIKRFEGGTGAPLGEVSFAEGWGFDDVFATPDGGLLAVWDRGADNIVRFDPSGRASKVMRKVISGQSGSSELNMRLAADGLGNIYALGTFNNAVFKFAPDGRFVNRFGSRGNQPGQFSSPDSLAVDNQGRVYVGDARTIHVFGPDGRFIDSFKVDGIASGMTFNDKNELFIASRTHVLKYVLTER